LLFTAPMLRWFGVATPDPDEVNPRLARVPVLKYVTASRVRFFVIGGITATLAAQALVLPILASNFGVISLVSPLSNLLAELLMLPLVSLSFAAGVLGPLALPLNLLLQPLAWTLLEVARWSANAPVLEWGAVSALGLVAYYAAVMGVWLMLIGAIRPHQAALIMLAGVLVTAIPWRARDAQVIYFDVGQGDSTLIRLPAGDILIDGGGTPQSDYDVGARVMIPALRSLGVRALTVIATHADTDHIEGLIPVVQHFKVSSLIIGHDKPGGEDEGWDALINAARAKNVPIRAVQRGMALDLGQAKLQFLNPPPNPFPENNWNSVAFTLEYKAKNGVSRRLLFSGDAPTEVEETMNPGALDVLKLGHHGSRFSTGDTLLRRTQPRVVIISSGADNRYGHPAKDVLERLKPFKPLVFRTDRDGAITYNLERGGVLTLASSALAGRFGEPGRR
jgi:competence protein ComEC